MPFRFGGDAAIHVYSTINRPDRAHDPGMSKKGLPAVFVTSFRRDSFNPHFNHPELGIHCKEACKTTLQAIAETVMNTTERPEVR